LEFNAVKTCLKDDCDKPLWRGNKTGLCSACFKKDIHDRKMAKARFCACGKMLAYDTKGQSCMACIHVRVLQTRKSCLTCNKHLAPKAKTDYCKIHGPKATRIPSYMPTPRPAAPYKMADLFIAASAVTMLTLDGLKGPNKTKPYVAARQAIWHLAKGYFSYPAMGRMSGGRDHSTVMHGCQRALVRLDTQKAFRLMVFAIHNEALRAKEIERQKMTGLLTRIAA
jgi:hypothetical protein